MDCSRAQYAWLHIRKSSIYTKTDLPDQDCNGAVTPPLKSVVETVTPDLKNVLLVFERVGGAGSQLESVAANGCHFTMFAVTLPTLGVLRSASDVRCKGSQQENVGFQTWSTGGETLQSPIP